jgi:hypothetical protein
LGEAGLFKGDFFGDVGLFKIDLLSAFFGELGDFPGDLDPLDGLFAATSTIGGSPSR